MVSTSKKKLGLMVAIVYRSPQARVFSDIKHDQKAMHRKLTHDLLSLKIPLPPVKSLGFHMQANDMAVLTFLWPNSTNQVCIPCSV
jgi:hypothetical protein